MVSGKNCSKFKVGDMVILTSKEFSNDSSNPRWGGEHGCTGTVNKIRPELGFPFFVDWDNGETNCYRDIDLDHLARLPYNDLCKDNEWEELFNI